MENVIDEMPNDNQFIDEMPNDVLIYLSTFLLDYHVLMLGQTCKKIHHVLSQDIVWQHLCDNIKIFIYKSPTTTWFEVYKNNHDIIIRSIERDNTPVILLLNNGDIYVSSQPKIENTQPKTRKIFNPLSNIYINDEFQQVLKNYKTVLSFINGKIMILLYDGRLFTINKEYLNLTQVDNPFDSKFTSIIKLHDNYTCLARTVNGDTIAH